MKRSLLFYSFGLLLLSYSNSIAQATTYSRLKAKYAYKAPEDAASIIGKLYYNYSGNRGGDLDTTILYDNETTWQLNYTTHVIDSFSYRLQEFDLMDNVVRNSSKFWIRPGWSATTVTSTTYDGKKNKTSDTSISIDLSGLITKNGLSVYSYTASGQIDTQTAFVWDITGFKPTRKIVNTYALIDNDLLTKTTYVWGGTGWAFSEKIVMTYATPHQVATTTYYKWSGVSFEPMRQDENRYTASGQLEEYIFSRWNSSTTTWQPNNGKIYFYNVATGIDSMIYYSYASATVKKTIQRDISVYDAHHNLVELNKAAWYDMDGIYETFNVYFYKYNTADKMIETGFLNHAGHSVDSTSRQTMTYNKYGQLLQEVLYKYDKGIGYRSGRNDYEYEEFTLAFKEQALPAVSINAWPVPASEQLQISLMLPVTQDITFLVYDLQGRVWKTWDVKEVQEYNNAINITALPAGNYVLQVKGPKGIAAVRKIIIAH